MNVADLKDAAVLLRYRNHRDEDTQRLVKPIRVYMGTNEYHPDPCLLIEAFDITRKVVRTFDVARIASCEVLEEVEVSGQCADDIPVPEDYEGIPLTLATPGSKELEQKSYQERTLNWVITAFGDGPDILDARERAYRFVEEAMELAQAVGVTTEEVDKLRNYTFSRPVGETTQEIGGVVLTLAALCAVLGVNMDSLAEAELLRAHRKIDVIREKQKTKIKGQPLPGKG